VTEGGATAIPGARKGMTCAGKPGLGAGPMSAERVLTAISFRILTPLLRHPNWAWEPGTNSKDLLRSIKGPRLAEGRVDLRQVFEG